MGAAPAGQVPSEVTKILARENWPTPTWYLDKQTRKFRSYEEHFAFHLRVRYLALEVDFRSVLGNFPDAADVVTAGRISDTLRMARETLERGTTNLLGVSSALDLVERLMVWLCPEHMQRARIEGLLVKFGSLSFKGRDLLKQRLETLAKLEREQYPGQFRSVLDETTGIFNAAVVEDLIASGLQINRLRAFRNWGLLALFIFLLVAPLATNTENVSDWPSRVFDNQLPLIESWINALAMMIVGGMGGFLSGLLQARSTRVTLAEYLESMLRLQLRPLVGALVAVVLYTILSWQLLAGIEIRNAGSYFLIAFLSGFSERYFLRLLKTETQESAARVIETGEPADAGRENKH